jgi:predicted ATPase/class 3 adenylate cyclase
MSPDLPSGTVTFLFTDIEGSTKLAQEQRDTWESLRARHHAILRSAIEANNGHVFQIIGDAFCAAFHTVREALQASLAAQNGLQAENWGQTPIKVRMGINTGAAQAGSGADGSGGYTGYSTLARTQRVMSTAYGGQILLSNTSAELLLGEFPAGVSLRDMKEHRLKGLLNPEHLWQVVATGLPQDFPALQTLNSIPNNLPLQLTSFIGREKEISEIKSLVEHNRLVTLTGSGGVGKTRHSLQVGAEVLDAFADGVWLVELAPVSSPELVPQALASVLGVHEDQARPLMTALQDHLQPKTILLLFDNCEHLLEACAQLADGLLHACSHLKILVSSREALGMAGEVSFRVPSLSLPDAQHLPSLERLTQYDSVRLFVERAVAVKSDFVVANHNAPAVAQICSRLDGIPLAIELAAARLRGLSAEQISERLDDRFRLLTGGSRTALPRQQTLRAMIEWSYDLLSEAERVLLRRLAVFVGDWTLEAAEAVCAEPDSPAGSRLPPALGAPVHSATVVQAGQVLAISEVLDLLLRLVDKSLIVPEERAGQARYHMLETIRQFALDKLLEAGEGVWLRLGHLEFFLEFAGQAEARLNSAENLIWLHQLGSEYENLQAALTWASEAGSAQPALRLELATEQLADVQVLLGIGTQAIPLYQAALELWQSVSGADKMIGARLHGKILQTVTFLKMRIDADRFKPLVDVASASNASLEAALKAAENEPPSLEKVRLLTILSTYAQYDCVPVDWDLAEGYARRALEMAGKLDAALALSMALGTLGELYFNRGLWRELVQVCLQRLALSRDPRFNNLQERLPALIDTAQALTRVGEYAQAIPFLLEGESLAAQMQDALMEKYALDERTHCLFRLDRWDEILNLGEKMRDMQQRYPREQIGASCQTIAMIASIHAMRGEMDLALIQRNEAQAIMTAVSGSFEHWVRTEHY